MHRTRITPSDLFLYLILLFVWFHRSWTGGDMGDYRLAHLCYCTAVFFEYERAEYRNQRD